MTMKRGNTSERIIQKVGDDMIVVDTVKVREIVKNVTTTKVNEEDITKALIEKIKKTIEETLKQFTYLNPVPKDFEYPRLIPIPTNIPVPQVDADKVVEDARATIREAIGKIDIEGLIKNLLKPIKIDKPEYVITKVEIPKIDMEELKETIKSYIQDSLKQIDLKALLKDVLGEVDLTIYNPIYKDLPVPQIVKGRQVTEHKIITRERIITLAGYRVIDEQGDTITEVKSEIK